ncbi:pyruvate dehydrogenase (acetyl-transferring) kinase, mitochondrial [Tanacetum coccineum]
MSLTGAASRWLRNKPSGSITTWEDLKTKFLRKYCPPARTAKKMEINNFQQEPDENLYQAWERFKKLLMKCPQHYLTKMQEVVLFYNGFDVPTRQILDSRGAIPSKTAAHAKLVAIQRSASAPEYFKNEHQWEHWYQEVLNRGGYRATASGFYQRNNVNPSYQERRQSMEDTLSKFMSESKKRHEENFNLIKEIRASTDASIRNQGASIKTLEIQIGQMSKFSKAYSYGASHNSIPEKEKDPGSFTLTCFINNICFNNALADLGASVGVMPLLTYLNLGLGKLAHTKLTVELADRTVKYPKGIAKNVLLEARLMGETLVLNRSLDPFFKDYIELNDLNVPLELRRDQVDDLIPTIKEGEVVEEFRARNDARMVSKNFGYPSDCDHDKKIRIDCAYNLKFSCMIDFAVLEDMDAYRDEGMGSVIFGQTFLREVGINAKWFEGMITIHNGNEEVTYQMVRSHPRFKHHTNEQCNKIPPLLKGLAERKEVDEVGEVSIIWNPMYDCSHAGIQTHLQHTSLLINST